MASPEVMTQAADYDWRMELEFHASSLWDMDPVPALTQILDQIQGLGEHRANISTILTELFCNAVDHGLLELDSALKDSAEGFAEYYAQRERRLAALAQGWVRIGLTVYTDTDARLIEICVADSGRGFDTAGLRNSRLCEHERYAGRGLGLVCHLCRELRFDAHGTRASAVYELQRFT